jgi:hypothetical protein
MSSKIAKMFFYFIFFYFKKIANGKRQRVCSLSFCGYVKKEALLTFLFEIEERETF